MKKYLLILSVFTSACTREGENTPMTLQDEVIEINWNYAVKDLYWIEAEPEASDTFTMAAPSGASRDFSSEKQVP